MDDQLMLCLLRIVAVEFELTDFTFKTHKTVLNCCFSRFNSQTFYKTRKQVAFEPGRQDPDNVSEWEIRF